THLVELGFPVIGPQCAITVLKHKIQLKSDLKYPVCNLTMLGTLVSFSNIEPTTRAELITLVEKMGGKVSRELTGSVTHLVVKEVGSVKYFSACHVKIPIMKVDWIAHLWTHGQSRYISAKEGRWLDFKCPIFLGCSICVTGFGSTERSRIQKLVIKFGGEYSGAMKLDVTTHLVVHKPEGQKYAMAKKFGVKVVNVNWVYQSVEKEWCQDHTKFPVDMDRKFEAHKYSLTTTIVNLCNNSNYDVRITIESTEVIHSGPKSSCRAKHPNSRMDKLWSFNTSANYDTILDGLSLYLAGFQPREEEKMKQIVNLSGATRYNKLTPGVTHVIVGSAGHVTMDITSAVESTDISVVSYRWVLDSLERKVVEREVDYWEDGVIPRPATEVTEVDSPLPKNNTRYYDVTVDMQELLSQYLGEPADGGNDESAQSKNNESEKGLFISFKIIIETSEVERSDIQNSDTQWSIFRGKKFALFGFDSYEVGKLNENIQSLDGNVISMRSKMVADYAVVPTTGCLVERTVGSIVTDFWIESCITDMKLHNLDTHPMFTPFNVPDNAQPLEGSVACISQYQDPLRHYLIELIEELGGRYQDNVAKKDIPSESLLRTTHLIVMSPDGDKYNGCKKWGIPTISAEWVYECARSGQKVPEDRFPPGGDNKPLLEDNGPAESSFLISCIVFYTLPLKLLLISAVEVALSLLTAFSSTYLCESAFSNVVTIKTKARNSMLNLESDLRCAISKLKPDVKMGLDSPSTFMTKGVDPNISFDLEEVFEYLKTPQSTRQQFTRAPLSVFVERFLAESLKDLPESAEVVANLEKIFESEFKNATPLLGTIVYVAKKLTTQRAEICKTVTRLGGAFRWNYDSTCTHFVFQGRSNDINKEFRTARTDGKFIVSPHWVAASERVRADEKEFPHDFDPNKSIQVKFFAKPHYAEHQGNSDDYPYCHVFNNDKTASSGGSASKRELGKISMENERSVHQDSQEARESLRKTLENIMSSDKVSRDVRTHRLSCKCNTTYSPKEAEPSSAVPMEGVTIDDVTKGDVTMATKDPESSQDVQVVWDDPIGREELQRLRQQNKVDPETTKDESSVEVKLNLFSCHKRLYFSTHVLKVVLGTNTLPKSFTNLTVPPLFPLSYSPVDEDENRISQIIREGKVPSFLISSVTPEQKAEYASIIQELGGKYLERDYFDPSCTHLIVKNPARNEKFLASLSSGKWILHTSYMEACRSARAFVKEEDYEFGNPSFEWTARNETEALLVASAYRWRQGLNRGSTGAFHGWKVILHVSDRHLPGFARLLECGSGSVVA
uniref:BRCT domain-containing protein n=1 Tax=Ciona savignyi TaxID=51511 RepID=H2Z8T6_CIOSA